MSTLRRQIEGYLTPTASMVGTRIHFMDQFFAYDGLSDYYKELAKQEGSDPETKKASALLNLPQEKLDPELSKVYTCNPSWPICLFDFTFRNLNPKFSVFRVENTLD